MTDILVRAEKPSDIQAIDVVNISAFEGDAEAQLVSDLRASPAYVPELSLVAEYKNRLVGHIMLTRAGLFGPRPAADILALAPMSVVPSQSDRGIGRILLRTAIDRARQMGFGAIVVVGRPEYYRRHGFKPAAGLDLGYELDVDDEIVTLMELKPGTLAGGGRLVFPPPFESVFSRAA